MFGFNRCAYDWLVLGCTYAPPLSDDELPLCYPSAGSEYQQKWQGWAMGLTTVLMQCSRCKITRKEEMAGAPVKDPQSVVRVDKHAVVIDLARKP